MVYLSHVNYVEKRFEFYKHSLKQMKSPLFLKQTDIEFTMNLIAASLVAIKLKAGIEKISLSLRLKIFVLMFTANLKKNKNFFTVCSVLGLVLLFLSLRNNIGLIGPGVLIYTYILFVTTYLTYTRMVIDVLNVQNSTIIENHINLSVGNEPIELLISSELAVQLIHEYTDEVIYSIGFSEIVNRENVIKLASDEIKYFIEDTHMKKMFIAGGRYFHVAGLIALIDLCYSSLQIDLDKNSIKSNAISALYEIEDGKSKRVEDIKVIIHDWIYESMYDIDYIESLTDIELMMMLILCKDELLYLKDKYLFYDNM